MIKKIKNENPRLYFWSPEGITSPTKVWYDTEYKFRETTKNRVLEHSQRLKKQGIKPGMTDSQAMAAMVEYLNKEKEQKNVR